MKKQLDLEQLIYEVLNHKADQDEENEEDERSE
jgi:hypothetical protein